MKASRNDPCPCGSGRKYKACCLHRDEARQHVRSIMGDELLERVEQATRDTARDARVWQADAVAVPIGGEAPALVLVMAEGLIAHVEVAAEAPATAEQRARVIAQAVSAAGRTAGQLPERLQVRDARVAELLAPRLRDRAIEVVAAALPELDEAVQAMTASVSVQDSVTTPDSWRETGASAAELAEFHACAAEFYRRAPWKQGELQAPLLMELVQGRPWAASVMGDGGMSFGLALYSEPADMIALLVSGGDPTTMGGMRGFSISVDLDARNELSPTMAREVTAAGWPVAGPRAYPRIFALKAPEGRVTSEHVRLATRALSAINALAAGQDPAEAAGVPVGALPFPFGDEGVLDEDFLNDFLDEEDDDPAGGFQAPDAAGPILPVGPGADPRSALRGSRTEMEAIAAAEAERLPRLEAWLHTRLQNVRKSDLENARIWCEHLQGMALPAGAVTEYDLRCFLYDFYLRKHEPSKRAVNTLRTSLLFIFRFLEESEGIRYPFAEAVLDELRRIEEHAGAGGVRLYDALTRLAFRLHDDLYVRVMLFERDGEAGTTEWPTMMSPPVAKLEYELQRRWLLWYDELVGTGVTELDELEAALLARQAAWENEPHPDLDGQTPAEVVEADFLREDPWTED
jgi:SEC-C motif